MKIILTSIGTRGDIEPFVAIGELLHTQGHEVVFMFPQQLVHLVDQKHKVYALSPKVIELIEGVEGRIIMGAKATILRKIKALFYLYREGQKTNKILVEQQQEFVSKENPDLIIHNVKCSFPTLWGIKNKRKTILLSPVPYFMYEVKGQAHVGFNGNRGKLINKLSYALSNFGLIKTINDAQDFLGWKSEKIPRKEIKDVLFSKKLIYAISPQLFKRPDNWPSHVQVLGYHSREVNLQFTPSQDIINFLNNYPKAILLTFGSMVNSDPVEKSRLIYDVLDNLMIPTIVNLAAGGLVELEEYKSNPNFIFIDQVPYSWILPKVYGIVHHGGSGTTHSAMKYGCVSLIIPHVIDQFSWNLLLAGKGVGPKGISINKINEDNLMPVLKDLFVNDRYKANALQFASAMKKENLEEELLQFITS